MITGGGENRHFSKTFQANHSQAKNEKLHFLNWIENFSAALAQTHPGGSLFDQLVKGESWL